MKITVTNKAKANRGFYDVSGQRISVKPGETKTAEVDEVTAEGVKANPDFEVAGAKKEAPKQEGEGDKFPIPLPSDEFLAAMSDEDFAALYSDIKGEKPHHNAKRETLIAKLKEAKGE